MKNNSIRKTLRFMQRSVLAFILVLTSLMIHDALRSKTSLNQGLNQLDNLKLQNIEDPELAKTVRDLDYLYRATYFQTRDKQSYGFLLTGIAFISLCCLMAADLFLFSPDLKIPKRNSSNPEKERRQLLFFSCCGLIILCIGLAVFRTYHIARQDQYKKESVSSVSNTSPDSLQDQTSVSQTSVSQTSVSQKKDVLSASTGDTDSKSNMAAESKTTPAKTTPVKTTPAKTEVKTDKLIADNSEAAKPEPAETTAKPVSTSKQGATGKIVLADFLEAETHQWPQFRGSLLPNKNKLPDKWDFNEKWKVTIPLEGFNSPVIWDEKIFVAGGNDTERAIFCFDIKNGKLQWEVKCNQVPKLPEVGDDTGFSAPTLCVDKDQVYGIFATGEVICCTHEGKEVWRKQLPSPEIMYGYASSPALFGDKLLIQYDLDETQTFYALDIHTGEPGWKTERKTSPSWSSPEVWLKDGKGLIFTAGNTTAELLDADTGKILWENECLGGEVATSATAVGDTIYFSNSGAFTGAFSASDGKLRFQNDETPAPDVASAILVGNIYLLFSSGGSVIAVDAKNGKELYEEVFDNGFYSSPVLLQGKIVAVNMDGDLFLLTADEKKLSIEGKYALGTKIVAVPAFHNGNIILRTFENELICLETKK